jgi:hypothetical protein
MVRGGLEIEILLFACRFLRSDQIQSVESLLERRSAKTEQNKNEAKLNPKKTSKKSSNVSPFQDSGSNEIDP